MLEKAQAREANEADKRARLAAGELGLDIYDMREQAGRQGAALRRLVGVAVTQTADPLLVMRGGTSKGCYFLAATCPPTARRATRCCSPPWAPPTRARSTAWAGRTR